MRSGIHFQGYTLKLSAYVNTGILEESKVRISKEPIIVEHSNLYDNFDSFLSSCYIDKCDKSQTLKQEFITTADCSIAIIDPETKEPVRRELFYDELENMWKAKIQIISYKSYFAMQIRFEDDSVYGSVSNYEIGKGYYWGIYGLPKNNLKALKWFEKSNIAEAFYYIGKILMEDELIANKEDAHKYMLEAAKGNVVIAQYYLARMYENGIGCNQNIDEAVRWYIAAAKQDYVDAQLEIAQKYYYGDQIEENSEEAFKWFLRAADNDEAKYYIGEMYFEGKGVKKDEKEAFKWYLASNDSAAKNKLGQLFLEGIGCEQSELEAAKFFASAAMQGNEFGIFNLGRMYLYGLGVEIDYLKAKSLFEEAAKKGVGEAYSYLGDMYIDGMGIEKNINIAIEMYKKAIELGSTSTIDKLDSIENT